MTAYGRKTDTREKILAVGARIVHQKGFHHTGIQEVLEAANVPKGSFYFYFRSKEAFGIELIDYYNRLISQKMADYVQEKGPASALGRLKHLFDYAFTALAANDFKGGCPIGNLSLEMADINEQFRLKLHEAIDEMKGRVATLFGKGPGREAARRQGRYRGLGGFSVLELGGHLVVHEGVEKHGPRESLFRYDLQQAPGQRSARSIA